MKSASSLKFLSNTNNIPIAYPYDDHLSKSLLL